MISIVRSYFEMSTYDGGDVEFGTEEKGQNGKDGSGNIHQHEGEGESDYFSQLVDLVELRTIFVSSCRQ